MKHPFEDQDDLHIDLTSLIDVLFMLLIFFILTMSFTQKALDINLPESRYSDTVSENTILCVSVSKDGEYFLKDQKVELDDISVKLDADRKLELEVSADRKAPFEKVLALVDLSKEKREGRILISAVLPHE
ncbi:MAG: ExbD/TolR family protein [Succinivibrio sp.]